MMVIRRILLFAVAIVFERTTGGVRQVRGVSHVVPVVSRIKANNYAVENHVSWQQSTVFAVIPRGGGIDDAILDDNDNDDGMILQKVKSIVRSLLQSTKDIPIVQGVLSSLVHWIESSIGVRLMPQVSTLGDAEMKKKKKKKSKKLNKKSETKSKDSVPDKASSVTAKYTKEKSASATASKKMKPKSVSAVTSMQVKKDLKATNPNYRIQQELKSFLLDPPQHLSVRTGKNIRIWIVTINGIGIYEGETFRLRIQFPNQYPTVPPSVYFLPPNIPVHEHVYTNGDICLSLLGKDWRPTMTAQSVAHSILSILTSATSKTLPMDNARHAGNQPGQYQENWVYHDDNC